MSLADNWWSGHCPDQKAKLPWETAHSDVKHSHCLPICWTSPLICTKQKRPPTTVQHYVTVWQEGALGGDHTFLSSWRRYLLHTTTPYRKRRSNGKWQLKIAQMSAQDPWCSPTFSTIRHIFEDNSQHSTILHILGPQCRISHKSLAAVLSCQLSHRYLSRKGVKSTFNHSSEGGIAMSWYKLK